MLLLQEFDLEIVDKKGSENSVADHLSRLVPESFRDTAPFRDTFPDEQLFAVSQSAPWCAHIVNILVVGQFSSYWEKSQRDRFRAQGRHFF